MALSNAIEEEKPMQTKTTSDNFWAWHQKREKGYFSTRHKIDHPETIAKKAAEERELRESLIADGVPADKVEAILEWAERTARNWEQGAKSGDNASPMVTGYSLNLVFILRLLMGSETFEG